VADSRTSAASFACIEQLGVEAPPQKGWAPVKADDKDDPWLCCVSSADWIFHKEEQTYFHLPTSTLWEQREVKCCDPKAPPVSYFRVDAFHLKALSCFAGSINSAVIELAWQSWVRYTRKKGEDKRKKMLDNMMMKAEPERVPGEQTYKYKPSADGDESPVARSPRNNRQSAADLGASSMMSAVSSYPAGDETRALNAVGSTDPPDFYMTAGQSLASDGFQAGSRKAAGQFGNTASGKKQKGDRRGCCFCPCGRSRKSDRKSRSFDSLSSTEATSRDPAASASPYLARKNSRGESLSVGDRLQSKRSMSFGPKGVVNVSARTVESGPKPADNGDKHLFRLESFLSEVTKQPQRLVNHVNDRRAGKTHCAYVLGV